MQSTVKTVRDPELHKPVKPRTVTIKTTDGGRIRRAGRISLRRLADLTPYIVRSEAEQRCKETAARRCIPLLEEARKHVNYGTREGKLRGARITMAMRDLSLPMFGVLLPCGLDDEPQHLYVSASVLADWRREGIRPEVVSMPVVQRHGMRGLRTRDINDEIVRQQSESRRNEHAMGLAQEAWRLANLESDGSYVARLTLRAARHWLYHGNLKPCLDVHCPDCPKLSRQRRMQAGELVTLAFRYVSEYGSGLAPRITPKLPHRMAMVPPVGFLTGEKQVDRKVYETAVASGRLIPRK
jgi:hypothetical protein